MHVESKPGKSARDLLLFGCQKARAYLYSLISLSLLMSQLGCSGGSESDVASNGPIQFTIVSGDLQSVSPGARFQDLIVQAVGASNSIPMAGITITFAEATQTGASFSQTSV